MHLMAWSPFFACFFSSSRRRKRDSNGGADKVSTRHLPQFCIAEELSTPTEWYEICWLGVRRSRVEYLWKCLVDWRVGSFPWKDYELSGSQGMQEGELLRSHPIVLESFWPLIGTFLSDTVLYTLKDVLIRTSTPLDVWGRKVIRKTWIGALIPTYPFAQVDCLWDIVRGF
jgi:hypothetical protein